MYRLPTIELLNKDGKLEGNLSISDSSKPDKDETIASTQSVEDSATSVEYLHESDTESDKGEVDSDNDQPGTEAIVNTKDSTSFTLQSNNNSGSSSKPKVGSSSDFKQSCVSSKPQTTVGHQVKAKVISDVPKVSVGPKHYGAPIQKLPPSDKVMSAILQWKTSETMRFLAGSLPDFSKDDGDDEVSQN